MTIIARWSIYISIACTSIILVASAAWLAWQIMALAGMPAGVIAGALWGASWLTALVIVGARKMAKFV